MDIELSRPLPAFNGLGDYAALQVLVRLHGMPLGYVRRPVIAGCCSAISLKKEILAEYSGAILRHLLCDYLSVPLNPDRFRIEDLIKVAHPVVHHEALPLVTVAVCTRDRTAHLPLCLESLSRIEYPHLDLLIVDNAPGSDATERLLRDNYPNIRYIREPRPGLSWARNRVIIEAYGGIIAYTDDDCVVDPGWVKALVNDFVENPEIMAITGLVVPYELETEAQVLFESNGGFGKGFQRKWYPTYLKNGKKMANLYGNAGQFGTGANMAFRRCLFNRIGHFDPALGVGTPTQGGEDLEMFFRVLKEGEALLYEPGAIVRHRHRQTYSELRNQLKTWGIAYGSYLLRSALAYPEERSAFLRLGLWWLWLLNIRHPMLYLKNQLHFPWDLIRAEARGSLLFPFRFLTARSGIGRIKDTFGPLSQTPILDPLEFAKRTQRYRRNIGVFQVNLSQPLPALRDAADYSLVRIVVNWEGRQLGSFDILNWHQPIKSTRLREEIIDHFGPNVLDAEGNKNFAELRATTHTALAWHYLPIRDGS